MNILFDWFLSLPEKLASIGSWLVEPLLLPDGAPVEIFGEPVNMLMFLTVDVLAFILAFKIADLILPT